MEVYLARESKISRVLELEANVKRLSRPNSRLIAQIQRLETERNEIAQKLSQRCEQAAPPASQTTIYSIRDGFQTGIYAGLNLLALVVMGDMTWPVPVAYTLHVSLPGALCAGAWYLRGPHPLRRVRAG